MNISYLIISLLVAPIRIIPFLYSLVQGLLNFIVMVPTIIFIYIFGFLFHGIESRASVIKGGPLLLTFFLLHWIFKFSTYINTLVSHQTIATKPFILIIAEYFLGLLDFDCHFFTFPFLRDSLIFYNGHTIPTYIGIICYLVWYGFLSYPEVAETVIFIIKRMLHKIGL